MAWSIKEQGRQKLFYTDSKKWIKSEIRELINNHTTANLKQKTINTLVILKNTIKNNQAFSKREIKAIDRKIEQVSNLNKKIFKSIETVQKIFNYVASKNAKNPKGGLNKGIRGRTIANEQVFTKAGKVRKRFSHRAVNFNQLTTEHIGIILARFLKGWIKRSLIILEKIWSHDFIEEAQLGVYRVTFIGYDESVFVAMIQEKFGVTKDELFYIGETEYGDNSGSSEFIIRAEFTAIIDRFVNSGWHYGGN